MTFKTFYILLFALMSCSSSDDVETPSNALELIASYNVDVSEPSGLAITSSGNTLYTVSDNTNKIYKITPTGNTIQTFNFVGHDLEGISMFTDNKLLVAEERTKKIVVYDMATNAIVEHSLNYKNTEENSGIEGVAYNSGTKETYVLNEKKPGLLLKLNASFSIVSQIELKFAADYSGIFYDSSSKYLWIVSDQNKTIYKCNLSGDVLDSYPINVTKAEGIAVTTDKIYIISDLEEKLYIFKKPE